MCGHVQKLDHLTQLCGAQKCRCKLKKAKNKNKKKQQYKEYKLVMNQRPAADNTFLPPTAVSYAAV